MTEKSRIGSHSIGKQAAVMASVSPEAKADPGDRLALKDRFKVEFGGLRFGPK